MRQIIGNSIKLKGLIPGLKESQSKPKIALIIRAGNKASFKDANITPKKTNSTIRE